MGVLDFLNKLGDSQDPLFKDIPEENNIPLDEGDAGKPLVPEKPITGGSGTGVNLDG